MSTNQYLLARWGSITGTRYGARNEAKRGTLFAVYMHDLYLTHLPLDKMAAIVTDDILRRIFVNVRKRAVGHPCGSRTGPVGYEKHWRFPCRVRTTPVRASHGVHVESCELFDQSISVQPCQAVTGPVAWRDHENSTGVKFLRALRARNRTGAKNRSGPVVGCDRGIRLEDSGSEKLLAIILSGPYADDSVLMVSSVKGCKPHFHVRVDYTRTHDFIYNDSTESHLSLKCESTLKSDISIDVHLFKYISGLFVSAIMPVPLTHPTTVLA